MAKVYNQNADLKFMALYFDSVVATVFPNIIYAESQLTEMNLVPHCIKKHNSSNEYSM